MKIISTERSQVLAARVSEITGYQLLDTKFNRFPDGELYLRTGATDEETIIVASVVDNDALVQTLLAIDACDTSRITLVLPYLGYARQDKRFTAGEPISARAVARALSRGVDRIFVVNIHDPAVLQYFDAPAANISIAQAVGGHIRELGVKNPLILAPDDGAAGFAADVAAVGGWDTDHLEKTRISGDTVRMEPKTLPAASREVVIVDDIISTGGTLATATGMLYQQGATAVHAVCVHGVLSSGAYARLRAAGVVSVASSDTYENATSCISAAGAIAERLLQC